jgi:signal transduction histidine kinase
MVEDEKESLFGSTDASPDEAPSRAMLPAANSAVLVVCDPGRDIDDVCRALLENGVRPKVVPSLKAAAPASAAPAICFVEWSLDGAARYIAELSESASEVQAVAIVDSPRTSALAYAAGATATVIRPLLPEEVIACLHSLQLRHERQRKNDADLEHGQRVTAATACEATLRELGLELRTPLATGLANVEYLIDVAQAAVSPLSHEEHLAVMTDTLEAMQRIRATLEGMSVLIPWTPPALEPVRLFRVAQRVIDSLPKGTNLVDLEGDPQVRGFGDEALLVEVTSILVKRALDRQNESKAPPVSLHVYAHDTEARLTVRERPSRSSQRRTSEDPFSTVRDSSPDGQGGLRLAAARHAIVKMGGILNYVAHREAGSAFRIRLRLVQNG